MKNSKSIGSVYAYKYAGNVKIGETGRTVEERLAEHRTANALLELIHSEETDHRLRLEALVKYVLAPFKVHGSSATEHFTNVPDQVVRNAFIRANQMLSEQLQIEREVTQIKSLRPAELQPEVEPDEGALLIRLEIRDALIQKAEIEERVTRLKDQLRVMIGAKQGIRGVASYKSTVSYRFDSKRFKAEQPGIYAVYKTKESVSRRLLLK